VDDREFSDKGGGGGGRGGGRGAFFHPTLTSGSGRDRGSGKDDLSGIKKGPALFFSQRNFNPVMEKILTGCARRKEKRHKSTRGYHREDGTAGLGRRSYEWDHGLKITNQQKQSNAYQECNVVLYATEHKKGGREAKQ